MNHGTSNFNKSLKQLEGISQDIQFQVYLLRWLYKFAFKTSRIGGTTYSQFSRLDPDDFADRINLSSFNGDEIRIFIHKIEAYKFPESNIILKNQAKRLVHLFRILLVKDTLLEEFRIDIMLTSDRPLRLSKDSISLVIRLEKLTVDR
jgi:hypothetical protein